MKISGGDFFCGAGGFTEGAVQAVKAAGGTVTDWLAINHWQRAVTTFKTNHPQFRDPLCIRVDQVRPEDQIKKGFLDILLASPECTHHSNARGGKPMSDQSRAGAWSIVDWVNRIHIETLLIENVREFQKWGPLNKKGRPIKRLAGQTYQAFLNALRAAGYTVEDRIFIAADYGDPTTRSRLFIQAQRNRAVTWPAPSHKENWISARDKVIDWSIPPGPSIFTRKRPLSNNTLARIEAGLNEFGLKPFILPKNSDGMRVRSVDKPLHTVTTESRGEGLLEPFIVPVGYGERDGQKPRIHSVKHPLPTVVSSAKHSIVQPFLISLRGTKPAQLKMTAGSIHKPLPAVSAGGIHSGLVEPFLIQTAHHGKRRPRSIKEAVPTVAGNHGDLALCEPMLIGQQSCAKARPVSKPAPTVAAAGAIALVEPFITEYYGNGRARSINEPLPTATTRQRFGLVMPEIIIRGKKYLLDLRFRMLQPNELAAAQGFPKSYIFTGNKSEAVKQIGNAVPVNLAKALVYSALTGKDRS